MLAKQDRCRGQVMPEVKHLAHRYEKPYCFSTVCVGFKGFVEDQGP